MKLIERYCYSKIRVKLNHLTHLSIGGVRLQRALLTIDYNIGASLLYRGKTTL